MALQKKWGNIRKKHDAMGKAFFRVKKTSASRYDHASVVRVLNEAFRARCICGTMDRMARGVPKSYIPASKQRYATYGRPHKAVLAKGPASPFYNKYSKLTQAEHRRRTEVYKQFERFL